MSLLSRSILSGVVKSGEQPIHHNCASFNELTADPLIQDTTCSSHNAVRRHDTATAVKLTAISRLVLAPPLTTWRTAGGRRDGALLQIQIY